MRNDWETPPTVEELIVRAWIGEDGQPDVLHVQGVDVADDIGNLDRVIGDPDNPDPDRGSRDFPSKNDKVLWRPRRPRPPEGYYFFGASHSQSQ